MRYGYTTDTLAMTQDPPGLGSRGKRRYHAFAMWHGARLLREVKPVVPSAWAWATETSATPRLAELLNFPGRCPERTQQVRDGWIVRRRAPDAVNSESGDPTGDHAIQEEEENLFESMGAEPGPLHAGSAASSVIAADLDRRTNQDKGRFEAAVKTWAGLVADDQKEFAPVN